MTRPNSSMPSSPRRKRENTARTIAAALAVLILGAMTTADVLAANRRGNFTGKTAQGKPFTLHIAGNRSLTFNTEFRLPCRSGHSRLVSVGTDQQDHFYMRRNGVFKISEPFYDSPSTDSPANTDTVALFFAMRGRVQRNGTVVGSARLVASYLSKSKRKLGLCRSGGWIPFQAHRERARR